MWPQKAVACLPIVGSGHSQIEQMAFLARLFSKKTSRGIAITLLSCVVGVKNFNLGHNFLISERISFILGHNVPLGKTSDMLYFCVTLTSGWPWPWWSKVVKLTTLAITFLLVNGFASYLDTSSFGQTLWPAILLCDLDLWMTLTLMVKSCEINNLGHNFLISEQIYFILWHNVPIFKTSDMPYFCLTLTSEWPWPWWPKVVKLTAERWHPHAVLLFSHVNEHRPVSILQDLVVNYIKLQQ